VREIIVAVLIIVVVALVVAYTQTPISEGSKDCVNDNDCVVFGETGDCNCGCYNENNLPSSTGGECFCAAPVSCECVNGKCEGFFEDPEQACVNSGGTVTVGKCCLATDDFPNLCLVGPCGCSPEYSHDIQICDCGEGKCFDGNTCTTPEY